MMQGWIPAFAESTPRIGLTYSGGNDETQRDDAFLVTPAQAGVHASNPDWIPAYAGMTDQLSLLCIDDVLRGDIDVKARGA